MDKYHLNWKEFVENTKGYFRELRTSEEYADVTLACEDGQQIDAHKIVLSACSPFFQALLRRNQHQHPLIYMRGMKSSDLVSLLDFMYFGEIEICQDDLTDFLSVAEELKLKGLTRRTENGSGSVVPEFVSPSKKKRKLESPGKISRPSLTGTPEKFICEPETPFANMDSLSNADEEEVQVASPPRMDMDESRALIQTVDDEDQMNQARDDDQMNNSFDVGSFDPEKAKEVAAALENQVNEMIYRAEDGIWTCKVCSKTITGRQAKGNMKQHVETHIEGIQHTCTTCGKTYKNRHSLHTHISMKHRYGLDCKHPVQSIITPIIAGTPTGLDC